jgi:polysaccharide export outer membrane protein
MLANLTTLVPFFRRGVLAVLLALAACGDGDNTPIVADTPPEAVTGGSGSLALAPIRGGGISTERAAADYRLGPNDRTRIIVYGQPNLTGEFVLDGNGVLAFPLIGNVAATGMTPSELQRIIADKLDPDFLRNPSVSVEVASRRPFYVVGEVQKPGSYPYVTDMTVLNAIATAGGQSYRANMGSFYVKRMRDGKTVRVIATQETRLQPGDTVQVRERFF